MTILVNESKLNNLDPANDVLSQLAGLTYGMTWTQMGNPSAIYSGNTLTIDVVGKIDMGISQTGTVGSFIKRFRIVYTKINGNYILKDYNEL